LKLEEVKGLETDGGKKKRKRSKKNKEKVIEMDLLNDIGEPGDDDRTSTYTKFKTQNELDFEKSLASGPTEIELDDLDELIEFGQIV